MIDTSDRKLQWLKYVTVTMEAPSKKFATVIPENASGNIRVSKAEDLINWTSANKSRGICTEYMNSAYARKKRNNRRVTNGDVPNLSISGAVPRKV